MSDLTIVSNNELITPLNLAYGQRVPMHPTWHRNQKEGHEYSLYTKVEHPRLSRPRIYRIFAGHDPWADQPGVMLCRHRPTDNHTAFAVPWDVLLEENFTLELARDARVTELQATLLDYLFAKPLRQIMDDKV